jgi:hypothetical protein
VGKIVMDQGRSDILVRIRGNRVLEEEDINQLKAHCLNRVRREEVEGFNGANTYKWNFTNPEMLLLATRVMAMTGFGLGGVDCRAVRVFCMIEAAKVACTLGKVSVDLYISLLFRLAWLIEDIASTEVKRNETGISEF